MEIMTILIIAIVGFVILAVGGGGGYWFWVATRPKKMTWDADIYQVGDGLIEKQKGAKIKYKLSDLKPYTTDTIEKIDKKGGATYYWLQRLKKPTPVVTADCVEVWGKGKRVAVLLEEDSCTLLKKGYDRLTGTIIFRPMPHDRINMIKTEIQERNDRIENTKDILTQITPFITVAITMIALVVIAYISVQGAVKITEMNDKISQDTISAQQGIASMLLRAKGIDPLSEGTGIKKEGPPTIPP